MLESIHYAIKSVEEYLRKNNIKPTDVKIKFHAIPASAAQGQHLGRFHLPSYPKVAALLPIIMPRGSGRFIVCDMKG